MTRSAAGVDYNPFQFFSETGTYETERSLLYRRQRCPPGTIGTEERSICDQQAGYRSAPGSQGNPD